MNIRLLRPDASTGTSPCEMMLGRLKQLALKEVRHLPKRRGATYQTATDSLPTEKLDVKISVGILYRTLLTGSRIDQIILRVSVS